MTAFPVSDALLRSLSRKPAPDASLMDGYASGAILTGRASMQPARRLQAFGGRLTRPRPPRSPDREKMITRRRTLAATWPMPPSMAGMLTTSQVAYARLVADETRAKGCFNLTLDEAADRIGTCRKTAQRAQDRLEELGWITVEHRKRAKGYKHLPNIVRIVSAEWMTWIKRGPKPRSKTGHLCLTSETQSLNPSPKVAVERMQGAYERKRAGPLQPPGHGRRDHAA